MSLELGCNTLHPEVPRPEPSGFSLDRIRDALDNIAGLDYEAVEFSHVFHLSDDEAVAAGEYCRALGLIRWSAHSAGSGAVATEDQRAATLRDRGRCLEVTALLGARVMIYHVADYAAATYASGLPGELLAIESQVLGALAARAGELGVRIGIENGSDLGIMAYLLALVDTVDSPALGICVDTGHAALGELGPARAVRMSGDRLYSLHLQDNWGGSDHHLPPGCGRIDWWEVAEALAEVEYDGVLELELTDAPGSRPYHQELEMRAGAAFGGGLQRRVRALRGLTATPDA